MRQYLTITWITFLENIRSITMHVLLIIGLAFIGVFSCCFLGGNVSFNGQQLSGLSQVSYFVQVSFVVLTAYGVLGTVFLGMNTLSADIKTNRIVLLITRPISRTTWFLARITGSWLTVAVNTTILFLFVTFFGYSNLGIVSASSFQGFAILLFMLFTLAIFVGSLSLWMPDVSAGFLGIVTFGFSWVMGIDIIQAYFFRIQEYITNNTSEIGQIFDQFYQNEPGAVAKIGYWIAYVVVPHFGNVQSIASKIASLNDVKLSLDWWSFLFLVVYCLILIGLAHITLKRREF